MNTLIISVGVFAFGTIVAIIYYIAVTSSKDETIKKTEEMDNTRTVYLKEDAGLLKAIKFGFGFTLGVAFAMLMLGIISTVLFGFSLSSISYILK